MDLARKMNSSDVNCFTHELVMTASGEKMGKSVKGAMWLDPEKTSPYEYYQYWINVDDRDVERFMNWFTFISDDQIKKHFADKTDIRELKKILAFETTKILHGEKEATKARETSAALFGGGATKIEGAPSFEIDSSLIKNGINIIDLMVSTGLVSSKSDARRLIQGGGAYLNEEKITAMDRAINSSDVKDGAIMLRSGKKKYLKIIVK
jgi:tyrosyl-tRNA synthetase